MLRQLAGELLELVEEPAHLRGPAGRDGRSARRRRATARRPGAAAAAARRLPRRPRGGGRLPALHRRRPAPRKRANAQAVLACSTLPEGGRTVELDRDQVDAWLGALNDMRLALGTALGVTEETDPTSSTRTSTALQTLQIYGWLGWLQESLLSCLEPRPYPERRGAQRCPQAMVDQVVAHARRDHPDECCGVIAGTDGGRPTRLFEMEQRRPLTDRLHLRQRGVAAGLPRASTTPTRSCSSSTTRTRRPRPTPAAPTSSGRGTTEFPHWLLVSTRSEEDEVRAFTITDGEVDGGAARGHLRN